MKVIPTLAVLTLLGAIAGGSTSTLAADDDGVALAIALQHGRRRMAEAVASSFAEHHSRRAGGVEEGLGARTGMSCPGQTLTPELVPGMSIRTTTEVPSNARRNAASF